MQKICHETIEDVRLFPVGDVPGTLNDLQFAPRESRMQAASVADREDVVILSPDYQAVSYTHLDVYKRQAFSQKASETPYPSASETSIIFLATAYLATR